MIPGVGGNKLPKGVLSVDIPVPVAGDDVTFTFTPTVGQIPDPSTFTYAWYFNSNLQVGEITNTLTLLNVDEFDEGLYECWVTSSEGTKIFTKTLAITSYYYLQPNGVDLYRTPTNDLYIQYTAP